MKLSTDQLIGCENASCGSTIHTPPQKGPGKQTFKEAVLGARRASSISKALALQARGAELESPEATFFKKAVVVLCIYYPRGEDAEKER